MSGSHKGVLDEYVHRNRKSSQEGTENDLTIPQLYPNCDQSVWLRSCEEEVITPITGIIQGKIPTWICGSLLRNGPGSLKAGIDHFQHIFDSSALVHRFAIDQGTVTYQCRFVKTATFERNRKAGRIVFSEFGTKAVPDPCRSIFEKVTASFKFNDHLDNTMISIYPVGDDYYTFTETPVIYKIHPETLETEGRILLSKYLGIASHTSHPHVTHGGTVFNLGVATTAFGPAYHIICYPNGERVFENAHIVASVPCRWKFHPGYMHSFGISENYFLVIEQPLSISVADWVVAQVKSEPLSAGFKWFGDDDTCFYLIERSSGQLKAKYTTDAFFYLHVINQFEVDDAVIVDICCYRDPSVLNCMYVQSIENMQSNPDYALLFRSRPLRFILPLSKPCKSETEFEKTYNWQNIFSFQNFNEIRRNATLDESLKFSKNGLPMRVTPEVLCDVGCETPRINYESYSGKPYRYFYAISSDVDADNPGALLKVDTHSKSFKSWGEKNCYPSEPIFLPSPEAQAEDDGVILSALVWGNGICNKVGLLILCAKSWTEIGRCEFTAPGPVPKCLHGWFVPSK